MRNTYDEQTKAAVMAALLAGQQPAEVASEYQIPEGTVRSWKSEATAGRGVATQKNAALGELILGLLEQELITLQSMAEQFRDRDWLKKQGASEAAVLYGVMQDKMFRKIEALERARAASRPSDD